MRIGYEFTIEKHNIEVMLECKCSMENSGIGGYEYFGSKGYDAGYDFLVVEDITWDKGEYTEIENLIIQEEVNKNYEKIADDVADKFDPSDLI